MQVPSPVLILVLIPDTNSDLMLALEQVADKLYTPSVVNSEATDVSLLGTNNSNNSTATGNNGNNGNIYQASISEILKSSVMMSCMCIISFVIAYILVN